MATNTKKDSTNELPMYDLEEVIKLVVTIHEKGLETSAMTDVAKGCGYANPTSTPFYRRMTAARLFKLLASPKPELTKSSLDYLKPDTDGAKQNALTQAIMGIPAYSELIQQHIGKRLNSQLVSNSFARSLGLTDAGAGVCARVFISSAKFAGFISNDGTVVMPSGGITSPVVKTDAPPPTPPKPVHFGESEDDEESQNQTLYLDTKRKRKIMIKAPLTVTKEELERIRAWLGFQLIIEESKPESES
jgi:hypothetical protein